MIYNKCVQVRNKNIWKWMFYIVKDYNEGFIYQTKAES